MGKEHAEAHPIVDDHFLLAAHHSLEQSAGPVGRACAVRNDDAALGLFPSKHLDRLDQRVVIELPVTRRPSNRDHAARMLELGDPIELFARGRRRLGRVADRKRQLDQIAGSSPVLRGGDLEIEIRDAGTRVPDMDQLRTPTALPPYVARDPDATVTGNDHQVGPGRPNEAPSLAGDDGQALAIEKGNSAQRIVAHLQNGKWKAERLGKRQQLVVVAHPIVEQQPHQRLLVR